MAFIDAVLGSAGFWPFFFVVIVIGGGTAWMTGRSIAQTWKSYALLAFYVLLLACAARFLMFALFEERLLNGVAFLTGYVVLIVFALLGHRTERTRQMVTQYSWLNRRSSPLSWKDA